MKKLFSFLMFVAVTATTLVGCIDTQIEIADTPTLTPTTTGVYRQLTFSSDATDESRTHHNGTTIVWSPGDRIRIGYTKDGVWQNAEGRVSHEDSKTAKLYASDTQTSEAECSEFRVTQLFKDTEAEGELTFYGLYPSEITKGNNPDFANSESGTINVVLPQIQTPSATSFDKRADLLVSHSRHNYDAFPSYKEHIKMLWTRLVTHGMITIKNLGSRDDWSEGEKIQYVEFTADVDDALTGDFVLDIDDKELTATKDTAKNKVRLSFADSDHNTLDSDGNFLVWFATAPFTATNLTVKVGTDKATYTRTFVNANKTFPVNVRYSLGISMANATREDIETGEEWRLLTDASLLAAGKKIVIAAADFDVAMSTTQNNNNRGEANIKKNDDKTIEIEDDTQVFILRAGTAEGSWAFFDEAQSGYIYAASSSSNQLKTKATLDDKASWTINVTEEGIATVKAVDTSVRGLMQYNSTNNTGHLFSCYDSNTQKDIALYYNAVALETLETPVIDNEATVLPEEGNSAQITWNPVENALYYTVTCKCEGQDNVVFNNITDTTYLVDNLAAGTWSITVTAHADGYSPATSAPITVEISDPTPSVQAEPTELIFTAAGGVKTINVTTKNIGGATITAESDNATIDNWISVSGSTITVNATENSGQAPISGTITITATEGETAVTATVSVRQTAKSPATAEWQLLTDISSLEAEGLEVVIAAANYDVAMGVQETNNRSSAEITKSENTMSIVGDVAIFQLQKSGDAWTLFDENENGYLYAPSNSSNQLKTREKLGDDGNALWAIDIADGVTTIVAQGDSSHNVMQYNSASNSLLFSCYNPTALQKPVAIYYRLASTEPRILSLNVDNNEIGQAAGSQITVTVTTKYAVGETVAAVLTDSNGNQVGSDTATISEENTAQFTITANKANENPEPRELTLTVSLDNGSSKSVNIAQAGKPIAGANATDVIDREFTGVANNGGYSDWSGKTGTSGAVYAGNSAGNNNSVQLRSNNNNSGIVTTKSAGKVSKVIVTWNSNTADGRTLNIYGKKSAYSAATDLYNDSTSGELLGTIIKGTSTELTINGDYSYIGLRSSDGAMYLTEIQIVWGDGGETPAPVQLTMSDITCSKKTDNSLTFSWSAVANATGYKVSTDNSNWVDANGNLSHTLSDLTAGNEYTLYVKAIGNGSTYTDSAAKSANGTTSAAQGGDEGGATEVVDVLNYAFTGISGSGYTAWSGKIGVSGAVYAGQSYAASTVSYIQLRNTSPSGIITTSSGGKIAKVVITWSTSQNTTSGRYVTIYGKNTAYSSTTDLYDTNKQGESLGTIKKDTNTELTISGDYEYIGILASGALYIDKIEITWVNGNGGNTPVEPETPATPVLSINPTTLDFTADGGNKTVTCSIENKVSDANVTATANVDWLTISVSGESVTINATANTATTIRTATVTIAYTGAESKNVTVTQAAGNAGGGTTKSWVRVTSTDMLLSGGTFIIGYEATANSGVLVPMRSDMSGAKTSANGYHYSGTAIGTTTSNSTTINMSTISDTSAYEFTISASTTVSGAINIQRPDGNYIGNNNSKNTARLYTSVSANTAYGVTIAANDVVTLSCAAADTYKLLQYNSGNPRFANYTSGQKNLVIYKLQ